MKLLSLLTRFFRFFSVYVDPFEKKVDKFLKRIEKRSKTDLEAMMQEDLVKLTIFLEYKFKGYKKLKKRYRRRLYADAHKIVADFKQFLNKNEAGIDVGKYSSEVPASFLKDEHFKYLMAIMHYLKPGKRIQYEEAATFSKLLRDPGKEKLIGDCNQITTLYIFLFSLRYPISELQVKILPDHICLHYKGVDIEATSGKLADYPDYTFLSSVEEIVAANLLDISDPSQKQFKVSPKSMLKSAELAYYFSSHRSTVERNLMIAYYNLAIFYAKEKNFSKATLYANKSGKTQLQKDVIRMEANYLFKNKKYSKAIERFRKVGDEEGVKACYQNELYDLNQKIKHLKRVADYKPHKVTLRRMKELGLKLNDQKIVDFVNDVFKKMTK